MGKRHKELKRLVDYVQAEVPNAEIDFMPSSRLSYDIIRFRLGERRAVVLCGGKQFIIASPANETPGMMQSENVIGINIAAQRIVTILKDQSAVQT